MRKRILSVLLTLSLTLTAVCSFALMPAVSAAASLAGDVTGDNTINALDALAVYSYVSGGRTLSDTALQAADYTRNGRVNATDALRLFAFTSGQCPSHPAVSTPSAEELEVFRLVNEVRAAEGLDPITYITDLQQLTDIRADEIVKSFSHTRPDGRTCFSVFDDFDSYDYFPGGENIALGQSTAGEVMNAWMNSPGHRANILNPNFTCMIVGSIAVPEGHKYHNYGSGRAWVQLFSYGRSDA